MDVVWAKLHFSFFSHRIISILIFGNILSQSCSKSKLNCQLRRQNVIFRLHEKYSFRNLNLLQEIISNVSVNFSNCTIHSLIFSQVGTVYTKVFLLIMFISTLSNPKLQVGGGLLTKI